jgi:hypothetical protein
MSWLQSVFDIVYKFFKENIPTFALAVYQYLRGVIQKKENENLALKTELKTEEEKRDLYEKNKNTSDADVVDEFINKSGGDT